MHPERQALQCSGVTASEDLRNIKYLCKDEVGNVWFIPSTFPFWTEAFNCSSQLGALLSDWQPGSCSSESRLGKKGSPGQRAVQLSHGAFSSPWQLHVSRSHQHTSQRCHTAPLCSAKRDFLHLQGEGSLRVEIIFKVRRLSINLCLKCGWINFPETQF